MHLLTFCDPGFELMGSSEMKKLLETYQSVSEANNGQIQRMTQMVEQAQMNADGYQVQPIKQQNHDFAGPNTLPVSGITNIAVPQLIPQPKMTGTAWSIPPRVLVVDDDLIFRRLSTKLLQVAGCTIDVAVDGLEAITKLGSGSYDLVLMVCIALQSRRFPHISLQIFSHFDETEPL